jgi:hypothetical protein
MAFRPSTFVERETHATSRRGSNQVGFVLAVVLGVHCGASPARGCLVGYHGPDRQVGNSPLILIGSFYRAGRAGPAKPQARAEDPLSTHGTSRPPGDSASLPRHGSHAGDDRPEALPERLGDQHPQRAAGHRRVRSSKGHSIIIDRSLIGGSRPSGPRNAPAPSTAILSASSASGDRQVAKSNQPGRKNRCFRGAAKTTRYRHVPL